jgi:cephalosporin-C deacetylase-like acetyl esterase
MGYGEGGLIAMYAGALDSRIDTTVVSGYFQSRQNIWQEPVYRNVWSLLTEFGDAEIAGLIAPRALIVEAGRGPEVSGPPKLDKHNEAAPGMLVSPPLDSVKDEFKRTRRSFDKLNAPNHHAGAGIPSRTLIEAGNQGPGTDKTLIALLTALGNHEPLKPAGSKPEDARGNYDPKPRLHRQFDQLVEYTQKLLRESQHRRSEFWAKADASSIETWEESCKFYRGYLYSEVIGKCEPPNLPANPRVRKILDQPKFTGYEVMLDVWPDVFAYGILLIPKDPRLGERRPTVVCQHGLEGRPDVVVDPRIKSLYHSFGAKLADQGFVVFAPQNPFIGGNSFRMLQRKANPLRKSLFSVITRQHQRILEWLSAQPFVDGKRIGFYGISYGGKTAMRVPALLPQYALSICSADFNEFAYKVAANDYPFGFMFVDEYEVVEFDLANTFNHAELAGMIAPRPFMVERGHKDPVATDEWVSYEYAKVRRLYNKLGIPDRAMIEFFDGGHEINAVGAIEFLHKHLKY